ncbi:hypothetical protein KKE60_08385 [Patescibacteria group bacterium]|nr:hypothetical protein [Patescibacteria group bacterium]
MAQARDINKERQALTAVTKDKAFLNKIGIKAGTDLTQLKTTNPQTYQSLFKEVNRRAYEIPETPVAPSLTEGMTPTQTSTFEQAQARAKAYRGAAEREFPEAPTYKGLKTKLPGLREETGFAQAQKDYAQVLAGYMTARGDIRQKLIEEKGYDIEGARDSLSQSEADLSTARGRFLEGNLTATDYAKIVSKYHNDARNLKKMSDDLTTETDKGVAYYNALLTLTQSQVTQTQNAYNDLFELEKLGVTEASDAKKDMATTLADAYGDLEEASRWAKDFALKEKTLAAKGGGGGSGITPTSEIEFTASEVKTLQAYKMDRTDKEIQNIFLKTLTPTQRNQWKNEWEAEQQTNQQSINPVTHFTNWINQYMTTPEAMETEADAFFKENLDASGKATEELYAEIRKLWIDDGGDAVIFDSKFKKYKPTSSSSRGLIINQ